MEAINFQKYYTLEAQLKAQAEFRNVFHFYLICKLVSVSGFDAVPVCKM